MGAGNLSAPVGRLFVDVSYTRTQTGSIGVTRTVRSLLKEFQQTEPLTGLPCRAVAIHSSGFREVTLPSAALRATAAIDPARGMEASMLRWTTSGVLRRLMLATLPSSILRDAWRLYSRWTFDALSSRAPRIDFRPGDIVFMGDASWHYEAQAAIRQARQQGAQVVLMVHDLIPLRYPEYCSPLVSKVFGEWLERMLGLTDAVVCNSQATESDLKSYAASMGWPLSPVGHFRLGCDPIPQIEARMVRPAIVQFLEQPEPSFTAVGSFEVRKNYGWLLEVFEQHWVRGHNVCLLIAGRPTVDGKALIERMKHHPEQGRRLLTVFDASDEELEYMYARSRALLFPSRAEGFGLPLVEARTRGCPVIASDLPVFLELADEGVSLHRQNSFAEIEALLARHAEVNHRLLNAPMPAFTWNDAALECLTVMERLLRKSWKT